MDLYKAEDTNQRVEGGAVAAGKREGRFPALSPCEPPSKGLLGRREGRPGAPAAPQSGLATAPRTGEKRAHRHPDDRVLAHGLDSRHAVLWDQFTGLDTYGDPCGFTRGVVILGRVVLPLWSRFLGFRARNDTSHSDKTRLGP